MKHHTILFIIPFLFSLVFLNEGLFHYDAIVLTEAVEKSYGTRTLQPAINGRYGTVILTSIIYFPFWLLGHNADFATRLTSALFYAASIPAAYIFVNLLYKNKRIAIYAAILFAFHPIYLSPNTYGKEHGIALFFIFCSFAMLLYGLQKQRKNHLAISGILLALSHTIREATIFFIPFYIILLLFQPTKTPRAQRTLITLIPYLTLTAVFTILYLAPIFYKTISPTQAGTAYTLLRWDLFINTIKTLIQATPKLSLVFATIALFRFASWPTSFISLLSITSLIFFGTISTFAPRYLDITAFAISTLTGAGLAKIQFRTIAHLFFLLTVASSMVFITPLLLERHQNNGHVQVGKWLQENTPQNAVVITQDDAPFISYYGKRKTLGPPQNNHIATKKFAEEIKNLISNNTQVYMTSSAFAEDPGNVNKNLLPEYLNFTETANIIVEDFHQGEIERQRYHQIIWKLEFPSSLAPLGHSGNSQN